MSKRAKSKERKINPTYWIFCEGKTEEAYVTFLRSKYRLPVEIIPKVSGSNINEKFIIKSKQGKTTAPKDKNFLLYDGDIPETIDKLKKIKNATLLVSNPCIELWFLYHYRNQKAFITTDQCIQDLTKIGNFDYKKGVLNDKLRFKLDQNCPKACERASKGTFLTNPSSNVQVLIEELEKVRKEKLTSSP
jgi:hypothetical protein